MVGAKEYDVIWIGRARINLVKLGKFKVQPDWIFKKTKSLLAHQPYRAAYDRVESNDGRIAEFEGYYWTLINNVIIIYEILEDERKILVDATFFANTAWAHYVFWNIEPEDWDNLNRYDE